jgi:hypothetical protein
MRRECCRCPHHVPHTKIEALSLRNLDDTETMTLNVRKVYLITEDISYQLKIASLPRALSSQSHTSKTAASKRAWNGAGDAVKGGGGEGGECKGSRVRISSGKVEFAGFVAI